MKSHLLWVAAALSFGAYAEGAVPARPQAEIDHLLRYIEQSTCRFYRNGSWHGMSEARDHVAMKYEQARRRGGAGTAEAFIENAASRSSVSGSDYKVECPGAPATTSREWLTAELARFRAGPERPNAGAPGASTR
jgi:hypothetical protein